MKLSLRLRKQAESEMVPDEPPLETVGVYCSLCGYINDVPKEQFELGRYGRCRNENCLASNCGY